jgi:hypothetical protein
MIDDWDAVSVPALESWASEVVDSWGSGIDINLAGCHEIAEGQDAVRVRLCSTEFLLSGVSICAPLTASPSL